MRLLFTPQAWDDYRHWQNNDRRVLRRLNGLIEDTRRHPFDGIGKPEPLKGSLAGYWSRRITAEHRLVYRVVEAGADRRLEVVACRYHY